MLGSFTSEQQPLRTTDIRDKTIIYKASNSWTHIVGLTTSLVSHFLNYLAKLLSGHRSTQVLHDLIKCLIGAYLG